MLLQEGKPVAFYSKAFGEKHLGLSIYEKKYLSIINVVEKWRSYLLGKHFVIKTNHNSMKYLLDQKITTVLQKQGLTKLLGLDYDIQYKKGADNCVANSLFRRMMDEDPTLNAISVAKPMWVEEVLNSYSNDNWAKEKLTTHLICPDNTSDITLAEGLIRYKQRIYVGKEGNLIGRIITQMHDSPSRGHFGATRNLPQTKILALLEGKES